MTISKERGRGGETDRQTDRDCPLETTKHIRERQRVTERAQQSTQHTKLPNKEPNLQCRDCTQTVVVEPSQSSQGEAIQEVAHVGQKMAEAAKQNKKQRCQ